MIGDEVLGVVREALLRTWSCRSVVEVISRFGVGPLSPPMNVPTL